MGNEWKSTEWQERAKHKRARYYIRDEIEEIIKEDNIDRTRFHEVSKLAYENIISRFYYSFADHENYPKADLEQMMLRFHKRLKMTESIYFIDDWVRYIRNIYSLLPDTERDNEHYLILGEGWVYEGYIPEMIAVLSETDCGLKDFYIVSKQFDRLIANSDDGVCMFGVYLD